MTGDVAGGLFVGGCEECIVERLLDVWQKKRKVERL